MATSLKNQQMMTSMKKSAEATSVKRTPEKSTEGAAFRSPMSGLSGIGGASSMGKHLASTLTKLNKGDSLNAVNVGSL